MNNQEQKPVQIEEVSEDNTPQVAPHPECGKGFVWNGKECVEDVG